MGDIAPAHSITSSARDRIDFRDCQSQRLSGREIDGKVKFGRLFYRNISRLCSLEKSVSTNSAARLNRLKKFGP